MNVPSSTAVKLSVRNVPTPKNKHFAINNMPKNVPINHCLKKKGIFHYLLWQLSPRKFNSEIRLRFFSHKLHILIVKNYNNKLLISSNATSYYILITITF